MNRTNSRAEYYYLPEVQSKKLRIGFVTYDGSDITSGGYRYNRKLLDFLQSRGHTVEQYSLPNKRSLTVPRKRLPASLGELNQSFDVLIEDGICAPLFWYWNRYLTEPDTIVGLIHYLRQCDPTTTFSRYSRYQENTFLRTLDTFIATSNHTRKQVMHSCSTVDPGIVVYPGGRNEAHQKIQLDRQDNKTPLRVLFIGNITPRKNVSTLLEAVQTIPDKSFEILIVGDHTVEPAYTRKVQEQIQQMDTSASVKLLGNVSAERLHSLLCKSHVCCVPSLYEPFGMVYLEAMEYGVVPVASNNGGANELINHGKNGFLVQPDSTANIADTLRQLSEDRSVLIRCSSRARRTANAFPDWSESLGQAHKFLNYI